MFLVSEHLEEFLYSPDLLVSFQYIAQQLFVSSLEDAGLIVPLSFRASAKRSS